MPRVDGTEQGVSKSDMIAQVMAGQLEMPAPRIRAAVWRQFGAEVTTQEIAQARKKLRQAQAPAGPVKEPAKDMPKKKPEAAAKVQPDERPPKKAAPARVRARDYAGADVTVKQLSAILEVAEQVGGLGALREALRTMMLLRDKVGNVDQQQLAFALDFLARLTGK
jgi:hypothetical protein